MKDYQPDNMLHGWEIGALIGSVKFLSPEVALYVYKSTIQPYMEYCCYDWAGAPSCYL